MNDERDDNLSGRLAQAVAQLVESPAAQEPPRDLDAVVLGALTTATRKRRVPVVFKVALAAALLVAVGSVLWIGKPGRAGSLYRAVAERLETAKTVVYHVQWVDDAGLVNAVPGDGDKVIHVAPSHDRIERPNGTVTVIDTALAKAVELDPANRRARVLSGQMAAALARMARSPVGLLETLRKHFRGGGELPAGVESLDEKEIGGVQALGMRSTVGGEIVEAWIDPATKLPVEVRVRLDLPPELAGRERPVRMWRVFTNLKYDVPVDRSLVSVVVPPGYTAVELPDMPIDVKAAPAGIADLVALLRLCARHNHSTFPDTLGLNDSPASAMAIMKRFANSQEKAFESGSPAEKQAATKAVMEFGTTLGRATRFLAMMRPDEKPHYNGAGVKLDTPGKPIFWYSPTRDGRYQVVFADLSVKELGEAELPKLAEKKAPPEKPEDRNVVRSVSPRVKLPQSAVTKYAELERIRKEGRQATVRNLELAWMPEMIAGNAKADPETSRLAFLAEFRNLEGLKIDYLVLSEQDLAVIGRLSRLKKLSLSGVQIAEAGGGRHFLHGAELAPLGQLVELAMLDLSQSDFAGGLKHLAGLAKLDTLILSSFEHLNDASVAQLKELPHLQTLVLAGVYYTNPEKTITDAGLASLAKIPSLRTLYVEFHGRFTLPVDKLQTLLPDVEVRRGYQEE